MVATLLVIADVFINKGGLTYSPWYDTRENWEKFITCLSGTITASLLAYRVSGDRMDLDEDQAEELLGGWYTLIVVAFGVAFIIGGVSWMGTDL